MTGGDGSPDHLVTWWEPGKSQRRSHSYRTRKCVDVVLRVRVKDVPADTFRAGGVRNPAPRREEANDDI